MTKKYKKLRKTYITDPFNTEWDVRIPVMRIVACRDIPRHGVKKGDLGGYLGKGVTLSQTGDAWIAGDAVVLGNITVNENGWVGGEAEVHGGSHGQLYICEDAQIGDKVVIDGRWYQHKSLRYIGGSVVIGEFARIFEPKLIIGELTIRGNTHIEKNVKILASGLISGRSHLQDQVVIHDQILLDGNVTVGAGSSFTGDNSGLSERFYPSLSRVYNGKIIHSEKPIATPPIVTTSSPSEPPLLENNSVAQKILEHNSLADRDSGNKSDSTELLSALTRVREKIDAYRFDIVKIIKYPTMTDLTDSYTAEMMFALQKAEAKFLLADTKKTKKAISKLEQKFQIAESNALKISQTNLDEDKRNQLAKATNLFAIAHNDGSSENEKKIALKQGMKQLEGIVALPQPTVEKIYARAGLVAIEM